MAGFDIKQESVAAEGEDVGTVVHVTDRNDVPVYADEGGKEPVTITVAGTYSRVYRRCEEQIRKRPIRKGKVSTGQFHDENREKAIACTLSWSGFVSGKTPIECNRTNVAALYEGCPWVFDQVWEAMNDHALFTSGSAKP